MRSVNTSNANESTGSLPIPSNTNGTSTQERYREAGLLGKVKYTVFGMDTNENNSET